MGDETFDKGPGIDSNAFTLPHNTECPQRLQAAALQPTGSISYSGRSTSEQSCQNAESYNCSAVWVRRQRTNVTYTTERLKRKAGELEAHLSSCR